MNKTLRNRYPQATFIEEALWMRLNILSSIGRILFNSGSLRVRDIILLVFKSLRVARAILIIWPATNM